MVRKRGRDDDADVEAWSDDDQSKPKKRRLRGEAAPNKPERFVGGDKVNPMQVEAWIAAVGDYLELTEVPEEGKAKLAASYLGGQALILWRAEAKLLEQAGKEPTWEIMKQTLTKRYVPKTQKLDKAFRLFDPLSPEYWAKDLKRMPEGWSAEAVLAAYRACIVEVIAAGWHVPEPLQVLLFLVGNRPEVRALFQLDDAHSPHQTFESLENRFREVEQQILALAKKPEFKRDNLGHLRKGPQSQQSFAAGAAGKPSTSGAPGPSSAGAAGSAGNNGAGPSTGSKCFLCEQVANHLWTACPKLNDPAYAEKAARLRTAQAQRQAKKQKHGNGSH
jgi:hypothetical protein